MPDISPVTLVSVGKLQPSKRKLRTHSKKQVRQLADSILQFGFIGAIVTDEHHNVLAGYGRLLASKLIGLGFQSLLSRR